MNLFVTGATGFIGSHFVNEAQRAGHGVVALRRPGSHPRFPLNEEPTWLEGTLEGDYESALRQCDALVHLASHTPNPPYDTLQNCLYWNVQASIRLADQARRSGIRQYLIAGSCFEYGSSAERFERIPPYAPLNPTLSYPTSKAAASVAFYGFAAEHGLSMKILRIFQVFGEGEDEKRFWPSLRRAAESGADFPMTLGEQRRDFIEVGTLAQALVRELDFTDVQAGVPDVRNVGSGSEQSLLEFSREWWKRWGATGQLLPGAVPYRKNEIMRLIPEV
jgi:nucleoside-diphosphate-sugar epimerase